MHIVLTGTSRGIGLEFTRQYLEKGHTVLAVARDPKGSPGLQALLQQYPEHLQVLAGDVVDPGLPLLLAQACAGWPGVDLLINNAGVYPEGETRQDFELGFQVNAIAPWLVTQALLPALRKSRRAKVVQLTSMMGSIQDNTSGGSVAYRASKAALNMVTKTLAIDEPWLTVVVVHPGWVQTEMGGPGALISVTESVNGLSRVIEGLQAKDSGSFLDYEGDRLPW